MARSTPSAVLAVRRELKTLDELKPGVSKSATAAVAQAMARELDDCGNTASGMAACARVLDSTMAELRLEARRHRDPERPADPKPPKDPEDNVARIADRAARRRAGA